MSRWQVIRRLGEGGTGEVFLARTPTGEEVALKLLSASSAHHRPIFEKEAALLVRLRHPALASVLGYAAKSDVIFGEDRGPCFWMEYVPGEDLLAAAKNVDPKEIVGWLTQGLEALRYLHGQGVLHGDLSPGNVRITPDDRLKILDFAVASVGGIQPTIRAGTVLYTAPERISGRDLPAGDLFSLGTLFYEALSGAHPRGRCRSLQELVTAEARPLAEARPAAAGKIGIAARVLDRMIAVDLKDRFSEVAEVLEALTGTSVNPVSAESFHALKMFGADEAFGAVEEAIRDLADRPSLFLVHGTTGVGKTRFLREAAFRAAQAGIPVTWIPASRIREFSSREPSNGALVMESGEDLRPEDFPLLLNPLARLLKRKRLILLVEWNDDRTTGETRTFLQGLTGSSEYRDIHLGNLSQEETLEILKTAFEDGVAVKIAPRLFERTSGNPGLLMELIRMVRRGEPIDSLDVVVQGRLAHVTPEERDVLSLLAAAQDPVGIEEILEVSQERRRAQGEDREDLSLVIFSTLDRLNSRDLLRWNADRTSCRLSLPALETTLLGGMSPGRRRPFHEIWLKFLANENDSSPRKVRHAIELGETAIVLKGTRGAVESLAGRGRAEEALELIEGALRLIGDREEISRLLRLRTNLLNALGRFPEALESCEAILDLMAADEPPHLKRIKYWVVTGYIHQNLGHREESERRLREALKEAEGAEPSQEVLSYAVRAHTLLGMSALYGDRPDGIGEAIAHFQQALPLTGPKDQRRAELNRNLAAALARKNDWRGVGLLLKEAREIYQKQGYPVGEIATLLQEGNLAIEQDEPERAEAAYDAAERIAEVHEEDLALARIWNNQGVLERKKGRLSEALERLRKATDLFRPLGNAKDLAEHLKQVAVTEAEVGRFPQARRSIEEIRTLSDRYPEAANHAAEAEAIYREYEGLEWAGTKETGTQPWNRERSLRLLEREGNDPEAIRALLSAIYRELSKPLQITFVDRADYRKWVLNAYPEGGAP